MIAECKQDCFDSKKSMLYKRGTQYDINPQDPIAVHFDIPRTAAKAVVEASSGMEVEAKKKELLPGEK